VQFAVDGLDGSFFSKHMHLVTILSLRGAVSQATKQSRVCIQTIVCRLGGIASGWGFDTAAEERRLLNHQPSQ